MSSPLEKSKDMETRYQSNGEDAWGNRERKLYQKIFKKATELVFDKLTNSEESEGPILVKLYDIGAGGGNVVDTWIENKPEGYELEISGCDISETAIKYLEDRYKDSKFDLIDLEEYDSDYPIRGLADADIISIVDVMYYFGDKRDYKETLDEIWNTVKPGAIVVVADNLVRAFRRDYFQKKEDCQLLEAFTDYSEKVCKEVSDSGKEWYRYLKIRIYRKEA